MRVVHVRREARSVDRIRTGAQPIVQEPERVKRLRPDLHAPGAPELNGEESGHSGVDAERLLEQVERVRGLRGLHFVIVKPPQGLSTADVYRSHASLAGDGAGGPSRGLRSIVLLSVKNRMWPAKWMRNALQSAAAAISPGVEKLWAAFDKLDFVAHQLSGSGSAYFGVCRHAQHARRLAAVLRAQQLGLVYATRSCA